LLAELKAYVREHNAPNRIIEHVDMIAGAYERSLSGRKKAEAAAYSYLKRLKALEGNPKIVKMRGSGFPEPL